MDSQFRAKDRDIHMKEKELDQIELTESEVNKFSAFCKQYLRFELKDADHYNSHHKLRLILKDQNKIKSETIILDEIFIETETPEWDV